MCCFHNFLYKSDYYQNCVYTFESLCFTSCILLFPLFLVTEMIYLKKQKSAAFHAEATPDENCLQTETFANTFPKPSVNTPKFSENQIFTKPPVKTIDMVSDRSTPGIGTRSKGSTIQRDRSVEQVATSRPNLHDSHIGVVVKRCPPEAILDPLSSFIMLRAERAVSVEAAQENANTSGFIYCTFLYCLKFFNINTA